MPNYWQCYCSKKKKYNRKYWQKFRLESNEQRVKRRWYVGGWVIEPVVKKCSSNKLSAHIPSCTNNSGNNYNNKIMKKKSVSHARTRKSQYSDKKVNVFYFYWFVYLFIVLLHRKLRPDSECDVETVPKVLSISSLHESVKRGAFLPMTSHYFRLENSSFEMRCSFSVVYHHSSPRSNPKFNPLDLSFLLSDFIPLCSLYLFSFLLGVGISFFLFILSDIFPPFFISH